MTKVRGQHAAQARGSTPKWYLGLINFPFLSTGILSKHFPSSHDITGNPKCEGEKGARGHRRLQVWSGRWMSEESCHEISLERQAGCKGRLDVQPQAGDTPGWLSCGFTHKGWHRGCSMAGWWLFQVSAAMAVTIIAPAAGSRKGQARAWTLVSDG